MRAISWLRWRLIANNLRGSRRRDRWERFARILGIAVPVVLIVLLLGGAILLSAQAWSAGRAVAEGEGSALLLMALPRVLLLGLMAMLVLIPLGGAQGMGHARLLLLPIERRALHAIEVLARLFDPWIVAATPAMVLLALAIMSTGRVIDGLYALLAATAMVAVLVCVGQLASTLAAWILRDRRRGEWFTLGFVLVLTFAGLLPALGSRTFEHDAMHGAVGFVESIDQALPAWTQALPTELYARAIEEQLDGRPGRALLALALLMAQALLLYALSGGVHAKLLDSLGGNRSRRSAAVVSRGVLWPVAWLAPATAAVAMAQALTALRCVRGRTAVLLPAPMIVVFGLISRRMPDEFPGGDTFGSSGPMLLGAGIVFAIYALQAISMNQFATDRAGLSLQLLAPIEAPELLRGKALGQGLVVALAAALCLPCALIIAPGGSLFEWLTALVASAATYIALTPFAALASILLPRVSDLSKVGSGGNPHALSMLIGTLLVALLAAVPGLIVFLCGQRDGLAFALVVGWMALVTAIAIPSLGAAAKALPERRENLALVAQAR